MKEVINEWMSNKNKFFSNRCYRCDRFTLETFDIRECCNCLSKNIKGKWTSYRDALKSDEWNVLKIHYKQYLRDIDGFQFFFSCRNCGRKTLFKNLILHHKKYAWNSICSFDHLEPVCKHCHKIIHFEKERN